MIPVNCIVKHDPERGTYGDCFRACIASILEKNAEDVPHFFHDNPLPDEGKKRFYDWLHDQKLSPFWSHYSGDIPLDDLFHIMDIHNTYSYYILFGKLPSGTDHCVVCKGGHIAHNPAWYRERFIGPADNGFWNILVLSVK